MGAPPAPKPEGEIRLLVTGADMGNFHASNLGILESYKNGILRAADVIVPGPWFPEAVKILQENPDIDVGVHLTLTSEWINMKWRPLTNGKSFVDADGYFLATVKKNPDRFPPGSSLEERHLDIGEVEREFRAQIELLRKYIPRISFVWGHMNVTRATPEVAALVDRLTKEYGLEIEGDIKWMTSGFKEGSTLAANERIALFVEALEKLGPGTWRYGDHPALDQPESRAIFHKGYTHVAQDRDAVVKLLTADKVKEVIRRRGIKLITNRDLKPQKN